MKHRNALRILYVLCTALLILSLLPGCTARITLRERGERLIGQLTQLQTAEESLSTLYGSSYMESELFSAFASGRYDTPQAVYEIRFTDGVYSVLGISDEDLQKMPPVLKDHLHTAKASSVLSRISSKKSPEQFVLTSMLQTSSSFTDASVTESFLYLYVYESGAPITVSFQPQNDGIVQAFASPLFWSDLDTSTAESIAACFKEALGSPELCTVTRIP